MLFGNQGCFYTFSADSDYKWRSQPLVIVDSDCDLTVCPTSWPKNCQISPTEWLFFGGNALSPSTQGGLRLMHNGTLTVTHLDTSTHRLTSLAPMPVDCERLAHQVIFMPASLNAEKGTVYVFGGKFNRFIHQSRHLKYDVDSGEWTRLPDWPADQYSFNLIPLMQNRYILVVSDMPVLYDTERDEWIEISIDGGQLPFSRVQIGAFTLPICKPAQRSEFPSENGAASGANQTMEVDCQNLEDKAREKRFEMVWFGGIIRNLYFDDVYRVTLELHENSADKGKKLTCLLKAVPCVSNSGELAQLKVSDRFFYN